MSMLWQFKERTGWDGTIYYVELVETDFYVLFFPLNGRTIAARRVYLLRGAENLCFRVIAQQNLRSILWYDTY